MSVKTVSHTGSGISNSVLPSKGAYKPGDRTRATIEASVNCVYGENVGNQTDAVQIGYFGELALKAGLQVDV